MRVLVTGCESSGTSLTARILRQAGAEVMHRSATYDGKFPDLKSLGKALAKACDVVVVVFRDPFSALASQRAKCLSSFTQPTNYQTLSLDALAQARKDRRDAGLPTGVTSCNI